MNLKKHFTKKKIVIPMALVLFTGILVTGYKNLESIARNPAQSEDLKEAENDQCGPFCKLGRGILGIFGGAEAEQGFIPDFDFVTIPAGEATFLMGSPEGETDRSEIEDDKSGPGGKQVEVTFKKDFEMAIYEVTQEQWFDVTGTNPSFFSKRKYCQGEHEGEKEYVEKDTPDGVVGLCRRHPVDSVSWDMATDFIRELNERAGFRKWHCKGNPKRDRTGCYRLPTEAEWEFAARGGSVTTYYFGDNPKDLSFHGWYGGNSKGQTHPAGEFSPNNYGLFDMHGNVWEWTRDSYRDFLVGGVDPLHKGSGSGRVIRGGSWYDFAQYSRSAERGGWNPGGEVRNLGLRLARTL